MLWKLSTCSLQARSLRLSWLCMGWAALGTSVMLCKTLLKLTQCSKTQVAIELADRWKKFFPSYSIFWVHATKPDVFDEGLQKVAEQLGIPPSADTNVRNLIQKWLENPENGKWLLIVDNVDDKKILDANNGKGRFKLLPCIPRTTHGHVLFTTR